ncbi:hypothetical protein HK096_009808 [Nowakowskiella sp. JEL0078]|nr:hypothetical protein HK096_009808 [Nowakowskiella sp. JEL0078]
MDKTQGAYQTLSTSYSAHTSTTDLFPMTSDYSRIANQPTTVGEKSEDNVTEKQKSTRRRTMSLYENHPMEPIVQYIKILFTKCIIAIELIYSGSADMMSYSSIPFKRRKKNEFQAVAKMDRIEVTYQRRTSSSSTDSDFDLSPVEVSYISVERDSSTQSTSTYEKDHEEHASKRRIYTPTRRRTMSLYEMHPVDPAL